MSFDLKIVNNDVWIKDGKLVTTTDADKLVQDILKICLTKAGSNPIHPWYGSYVYRTIIGSAEDIAVLKQIAQSQLYNAVDNLKQLQEMQVKSFQRMSADEQIGAILDVSIVKNRQDPRLIDVKVVVVSKGMKPVNIDFTVSMIG